MCCFQRWRVLELLRRYQGSIVIRHRGVARAALAESDMVERGDHVLVNLQPLGNRLPYERYHDYGCVPRTPRERDGYADDYATKARGFLNTRTRTVLLDSDNLEVFVRDLLYADEIVQPVRDPMIVVHASAYGDLGVPLRSGAPRPWTSYENLQELVDAQADSEPLRAAFYLNQEILEPRPARIGLVPATMTAPWGPQYEIDRPWPTYHVAIPARIHIRGCNIGKQEFRPVLHKLKQALGNTVAITAPKYFHYISQLSAPDPGYFEWMAYGFRLLRKNAFDGDSAQTRRMQLIHAYQQSARRDASPIRYYDGSAIDTDVWDHWLPADLDPNNPGAQLDSLKERTWDVSVNTSLRPFNVTARFWYRHWDGNLAFSWRLAFGEDPGGDRNVLMAALRESLLDPERSPLFQDNHEFPAYRRYGYNSFDAFLAGWDWQFSPWEAGVLTATGTRHEYKIIYPIMNRNSTHLLLNYYPSGTDLQPILRLPITDQFFTEV
jgi:hypothetical protein